MSASPLRAVQPGETTPARDMSAPVTLADMLATGVTARQLNCWAAAGILGTHLKGRGTGNPRPWTMRDLQVVAVMVRLTHAGIGIWPEAAAAMAARYVDTGERRIVRGRVAITWEPVEEGAK